MTTLEANRKLSDYERKGKQSVPQITCMVTYPVAVGTGLWDDCQQ